MAEIGERTFLRALGEVLKKARESRGWDRDQLARMLRSHIEPRTVASYEYGSRHMTVWRMVEIAHCLDSTAARLVGEAESKVPGLSNVPICVSVQRIMNDDTDGFEPVHQWARNRFREGARELLLSPDTVREMAAVVGLSHPLLTVYLFEVGGGST